MKIDCSLTENYLKYKRKMCKALTNGCYECLLSCKNNDTGDACMDYEEYFPEKSIDILQKWVDENVNDDGEKSGGFTDEN